MQYPFWILIFMYKIHAESEKEYENFIAPSLWPCKLNKKKTKAEAALQ